MNILKAKELKSLQRNALFSYTFMCSFIMFFILIAKTAFAAPPSVIISSPTASITNNNTPLLIYSASTGTVVVKVDGIIVSTVSGENLDILADGAHAVRVEATNEAAEMGFAEVTFTVDTTPPAENVYVKISAGGYSTMIIKSDGSLWAWGGNGNGQLGDGSTVNKYSPVQIGSGTTWSSVSEGTAHTVALKSDGTLWAWGFNGNGRLGDGTTTNRFSPVRIGSDTNWSAISAGDLHTIALKSDGTLWAWGYNGNGQLGDGTMTDRYSPVRIGSGSNWTAISTRGRNTLALKSDGTLWAWGYNNGGQLGDGSMTQRSAPIQVGSGSIWVSIAAGGSHSVALKSDGTLWTWGYNGSGQLGDGSAVNKYSPVQVGSGTTWSSVAAGNVHTMALKSDGSLWTWGYNNAGQLGDGTTTNRTTPVQVGSGSMWTAASGGNRHTLALKTDGTLSVWGDNSYGQLGNAANVNSSTPAQIGFDTSWSMAAAGGIHTTALKNDGTLWSWGNNDVGQLGDGTGIPRTAPVKIGNDANWSAISAGSWHTIAIKSNTLYAWGGNGNGQLGDGTTVNKTSPVQVGTAGNWSAVSAGWAHTVALQSGTLWAWGLNNLGQLGDSSTTNRITPTQIGTDTTWTHVAAGLYHTIALKSDGSLWAWGVNWSGRLGDGTNVQRLSPVRIGSDTTWSAIAAGAAHTVALKSNGTLWAWGNNANGQLGDGTNATRLTPVQIGTDAAWSHISAGLYHTIARKSDGSLWAWGNNCYGQLGDGTIVGRLVPTRIGADNLWVSSAASQYHTVARKSNGTLWTWGYNASGQLGNGVISRETTPYQIASGNIVINDGAITTNNATVTLGLTALDASVIAEMQLCNDGIMWSAPEPYAPTRTWTLSVGDGHKTIYVKYMDMAGNWSDPFIDTIILDTSAPTVAITSPVTGYTNNPTPLLMYTVSDGNIVVKVDGNIVSKTTGSDLDTLSEGAHTVRLEATDAADNTGSAQVTFTVDTSSPSVSIDPLTSPVMNNALTITGTMEAGAIVSISANTTATAGPVSYPSSTTWNCSLSGLVAGKNTISITAADAAGNTTSISMSIDPGIIGLWHMDENWNDSSGYANNGIPSNSPSFSSDAHFGSHSGSFDGSNDIVYTNSPLHVSAPDNFTVELWSFPTMTIEFTPEASWVRYSGTSGQRYAVAPAYGGINDAGAGLSIGTNGVSVFEHGYDYVPSLLVYGGNLSGWNHIAVVYENKTPKLYINGSYVRTGQASSRAHVYPSSTFGELYSNPYGGLLDEVVIYNRSLTAAEILSRYNQTAPALTTNRILADVAISNKTLDTSTSGSVTIFTQVTVSADLTLKIYPEKQGPTGAPIYHATQSLASPGGSFFTWDGRNDSGYIVPDEAYLFVVEATNGSTVDRYSPPALFGTGAVTCSGDPYDPYKNDPLTISYSVAQPSRVNLLISRLDAYGKHFFKILSDAPRSPGETYTFDWYGKSENGSILPMSTASCAISSLLRENHIITRGDTPEISNIKTDPYEIHLSYGQLTRIRYTLSRDAFVTITMTSPHGTSVTIISNQYQAAGDHELEWTATDATGKSALFSEEGNYVATIQAVNPVSGSSAIAQGLLKISY